MIVPSKFQLDRTTQSRVIDFVVYWCAIVIFWCDTMWVVFTCRDDCSPQISAQSDFTGSSYKLCGILVRHRNILVWWNVGGFRMSRWLFPPNFSPIGSQMLELRHVLYSIGCILYLKNRFFGHKYRNLCKFEKKTPRHAVEAHLAHQFHEKRFSWHLHSSLGCEPRKGRRTIVFEIKFCLATNATVVGFG